VSAPTCSFLSRPEAKLMMSPPHLDPDHGFVTRSEAMSRVLDLAGRAARSSANILITGETGVGKGTLARWIHDQSPRRAGPLLSINCATLPGNLIEAELFGIRKGARDSRDGLFVEASGGTMFLDEIAGLSSDAQGRLQQVLETSRVRPFGGTAEIEVDARVISSITRDTSRPAAPGTLSHELYYRLSVLSLEIPPLRERAEDVPQLVRTFLRRASRNMPHPVGVTEAAMRWLVRQDWPGNVRQLSSVIERAVAITDRDVVDLKDVDLADHSIVGDVVERGLGIAADRNLPLENIERAYIKRVVGSVDGNISRAARILRIDRRTLYRKLLGGP